MPDPVAGYHAGAAELAERYEALHAPSVHAAVLDLIPPGVGRKALDVGAGAGRDAAWLASIGYEVVAAEPAAAMRHEGERRHPDRRIRWLDDRLPELPKVQALALSFDLILLSGVWMHVPPRDRPRAFHTLATLTAPGGLIYLSVRTGPGQPDRPMWERPPSEVEDLAREHGLATLRICGSPDQLEREEVQWTSFVFRRAPI